MKVAYRNKDDEKNNLLSSWRFVPVLEQNCSFMYINVSNAKA